jgi:pimeloyl-ACP methyl ester carboxylesterase
MADLVQLRGGRTAGYEVIGDGEPLLMFMGGPGFNAELMRDDAELVAGRFASYLIDPHGSGNSSPPESTEAYDHRGHAAFYDEVRQALDLGRVSVHGVSFGGTVALTYAALFPEQTVRCMAVSAFAFGTDADAAQGGEAAAEMEAMLGRHAGASWYPRARATWDGWTDRVLAARDAGEVAAMFGEILPLYCSHPDRPDVAAALADFRSRLKVDLAASKAWETDIYQTIDLGPLLGDIACPTLVVAGELDLMCGPAQAGGIARRVAGAEMVVIPDCGHFPAMESPGPYQRTMLDWDVPR